MKFFKHTLKLENSIMNSHVPVTSFNSCQHMAVINLFISHSLPHYFKANS